MIIDTATKYGMFLPVSSKDTSAKIVNTILTSWVLKGFGVPREIVSDRDTKFNAAFWCQLMERLGTELKMSSSRHPMTDGQTERSIRTINEFLRAFVGSSGKKWEEMPPYAEFSYNDSMCVNEYSPYQLIFGQNPELPWQLILPGKSELESIQDFCVRMQRSIGRALDALEKSRKQSAQRLDLKYRTREYKIGDKVYINTRLFKNILLGINRFKPTFIGPFVVLKWMHNSYAVDLQGRYNFHNVFNTTELKKAED